MQSDPAGADYLHITDADALARLLDLAEDAVASEGHLAVRVFSDPMTSFHPKAYVFTCRPSSMPRASWAAATCRCDTVVPVGVETEPAAEAPAPPAAAGPGPYADVQGVDSARRGDDVAVAGGGTDMTVGIDAALAIRPRPNVIVVLTDGSTTWPDSAVSVPVVAGITHASGMDHVPDHIPAVFIPGDDQHIAA
jgi:hypothetical protein